MFSQNQKHFFDMMTCNYLVTLFMCAPGVTSTGCRLKLQGCCFFLNPSYYWGLIIVACLWKVDLEILSLCTGQFPLSCHIFWRVGVCVAAPSGTAMAGVAGSKRRQPIRNAPLPVSSPQLASSVPWRRVQGCQEEPHKSCSRCFNGSLFTRAASRFHPVKFNAAHVLFRGTDAGDRNREKKGL